MTQVPPPLQPSHTSVFYTELVRWNRVDELVFLHSPEEHVEARALIITVLDHVILDTVLTHLPEDDHTDFLLLCQEKYHEPSLLAWLEERVTEIKEYLRAAIQQAKLELAEELAAEHDGEKPE